MTWLLETGRHKRIPGPSWDQIRDAILEMDGVHVNEVEITQEEVGSLVIGGGNNDHYLVVYLPIDRFEENYSMTLADPSHIGPDVTIIVQTPSEYPARMAVPLPLVLQVVEHFYRTKTLTENRYWEP